MAHQGGYVVCSMTHGSPGLFLQWTPYTQTFTLDSLSPKYAAVFSKAAAEIERNRARTCDRELYVIGDLYDRPPQFTNEGNPAA